MKVPSKNFRALSSLNWLKEWKLEENKIKLRCFILKDKAYCPGKVQFNTFVASLET